MYDRGGRDLDGTGAMFTPFTVDQESHILVYFTFEASGFGPRTELLLGPSSRMRRVTSSGAGPSNGVSWAMPPGPTSGTVMWTFEDVPLAATSLR